MKEPFGIVREGIPYVVFFLLFTVALALWQPWVALIPGLLTLFMAFFFRNPRRKIPIGEDLVLAPADGRIMEIAEIYEDRFLKTRAIRISIFLSIFNVHVNRCPIGGEVKYMAYREGKFIPAFKSHCSEINEKNMVGIENERVRLLVTQVTGFIARRIVCWLKPGDRVAPGQLLGLIKFGSCAEVIVPKDRFQPLVQEGDRVRGGETVLGRII